MKSDHRFSTDPERHARVRPAPEPAAAPQRHADELAREPHDRAVLRELFGPFAFGPVQTTVRHFPDNEGTRWRVYERRNADEPASSLYFESTHAVRRVRRYPAGWDSLSDAELERLSWGR
ncbi:MAG TPA: hypothetical protein VNA89_07580 [Gemmatimonadaceae bacterium]|nr:hypothetical protein [Gemmatimonadaceae bacterium]